MDAGRSDSGNGSGRLDGVDALAFITNNLLIMRYMLALGATGALWRPAFPGADPSRGERNTGPHGARPVGAKSTLTLSPSQKDVMSAWIGILDRRNEGVCGAVYPDEMIMRLFDAVDGSRHRE